MTARFTSNIAVLLAAIVLLCCSLAMRPLVAAWVGLGTGALILLVTLGGFASSGRGTVQRVLDGVLALLAAWTVVASRVFAAGASLKWIMFSSATAVVALALSGLVAHEIVMELSLRRAALRGEVVDQLAQHPPPMRVAG